MVSLFILYFQFTSSHILTNYKKKNVKPMQQQQQQWLNNNNQACEFGETQDLSLCVYV